MWNSTDVNVTSDSDVDVSSDSDIIINELMSYNEVVEEIDLT